MYYVYLLQCADNSFYTGITTDIKRRALEHNHPSKGAKYTRARQPTHLVYYEESTNRSAAQKREYALRKLSHARKVQLISNPILVL